MKTKNNFLNNFLNKNKEGSALFLGAILILAVFVFTFWRSVYQKKESPETITEQQKIIPVSEEISATLLKEKIENKEKIFILDIRSKENYQKGHILDSVNFPFPFSEENLKKIISLSDEKNLSVIIGDQSKEEIAAKKVLQKQKNDIKFMILAGGFAAWKNSGGNIIAYGDMKSFSDRAKVNFISAEEFQKKITEESKIYILDVRSQKDFASERIATANNIPLEQLEERRKELPRFKEILLYGNNTVEGFAGGTILYDLGFYAVKILDGGWERWKIQNFATEK